MAELSSLAGLIFSRDRALQLDAALRSFLSHCEAGGQLSLSVLYRTTSPLHARQYAELAEAYHSYTHIQFQEQSHFRQDVLTFLADHADLRLGTGLYRRLARLHWRLGFLGAWLLRFDQPRYVLFLVDDTLFVRDFSLADPINALEGYPQALGFSLRLGRNTTCCYTRDCSQSLPEFTPLSRGVLTYAWQRAELDFAYPLEVSSSIYRIADLLPLLNRQRFRNPNQLESRLAENVGRFAGRPFLFCFDQSVAFSNPVNQVVERYQNRAGTVYSYTGQDLAEMFAQGLRVDVAAFSGFVPQGCHQEVELRFYRPARGENDL
jgi:hypothetical protein